MLRSFREKGTSRPRAKTATSSPRLPSSTAPASAVTIAIISGRWTEMRAKTVIGDYVEQDQDGCGNDSRKERQEIL